MKQVYVLIREKKGKTPKDRFDELLNGPVSTRDDLIPVCIYELFVDHQLYKLEVKLIKKLILFMQNMYGWILHEKKHSHDRSKKNPVFIQYPVLLLHRIDYELYYV